MRALRFTNSSGAPDARPNGSTTGCSEMDAGDVDEPTGGATCCGSALEVDLMDAPPVPDCAAGVSEDDVAVLGDEERCTSVAGSGRDGRLPALVSMGLLASLACCRLVSSLKRRKQTAAEGSRAEEAAALSRAAPDSSETERCMAAAARRVLCGAVALLRTEVAAI